MNFFKRLLLKLEKKADERKAQRTEKTGSTVAEFTSPAPPKAPQQPTPSTPSPIPMDVPPVSQVRPEFTAAEKAYLARYPDVALNKQYQTQPYQHYLDWGKQEGRIWEEASVWQPPVKEVEKVVLAPRGHPMPIPESGENGFGYIGRAGAFHGKEEQWRRVGGALFQGSDHLVPKRIPYPDGYRAYKEDPKNWPEMAENYWFPEKTETADPGWQKVYERMAEERTAQQKPAVSVDDQKEIPL